MLGNFLWRNGEEVAGRNRAAVSEMKEHTRTCINFSIFQKKRKQNGGPRLVGFSTSETMKSALEKRTKVRMRTER